MNASRDDDDDDDRKLNSCPICPNSKEPKEKVMNFIEFLVVLRDYRNSQKILFLF